MKFKNVISMFIAAAITASVFPATVKADDGFRDVKESDWFYSDVK